jgi:hypothetical protein
MKRAGDKKDRKAFKGSRHNNEVARLAQRNAARHRGSPKAARENRKKERHHRGHNSSDAIVAAPWLQSRLALLRRSLILSPRRHNAVTTAIRRSVPRSTRRL